MALSTALSHFFQTFDETIEEEKHNKFIIWQVKDFYSLFHKLEKYKTVSGVALPKSYKTSLFLQKALKNILKWLLF